MEVALVIWLGGGFLLWVTYRLTHGDASADVHAPPQKTLLGAIMWPFYLGNFLLHKAGQLVGLRPKTDDE
jgi:hypothetical protein